MRRLTLAILFGLVACGRSRPPTPSRPGEASLDRIAQAFIARRHLVGLAVGVVRHDSVLLAKGYGLAIKGTARPVTDSTVFHLASVTKPFVATAVMQLVEQGKVGLDQPIARYLPYFTMKDRRAAEITVRQLLAHTAGLPDVTDYGWSRPETDAGALERYVRRLADSTLLFRPGTSWRYSNIGFEVLADLVAVVSGRPFEDYLQGAILTPLAMTKSTLLMSDVDSLLLARGHEIDSTGELEPATVYPYNRPHAGSSTLHSNLNDMLRWARGNLHRGILDGHRFLRSSSYDSLWRQQWSLLDEIKRVGNPAEYDSVGIGLSWVIGTRRGIDIVRHDGSDPGFRSDLLLVPDRQIGIVVMANSNEELLSQLTFQLLDAVTGPRGSDRTDWAEPIAATPTPAVETLDRYLGRYRFGPGFDIVVTRRDQVLYVQATGQGRFRLEPTAPGRFEIVGLDAQVEFAVDQAGSTRLILRQGGRAQTSTGIR